MLRTAAAVIGMVSLAGTIATYGLPIALWAVFESIQKKEERLEKEEAKAGKKGDRAKQN